jgi:hypothetical protein
MSDDIVKRLREWGDNAGPETAALHTEAADEIERLRYFIVLPQCPPVPGNLGPIYGVPIGCTCPPGSNLTCQRADCPRRGFRATAVMGSLP